MLCCAVAGCRCWGCDVGNYIVSLWLVCWLWGLVGGGNTGCMLKWLVRLLCVDLLVVVLVVGCMGC